MAGKVRTKGKAAFGTKDMKRIGTEWNTEDIWVRRSFNLDQDLTNDIIYLRYSHDDVFELYLNGEKLVATDYSWNDDVTIELSASAKAKLRKGTNIIAAHCHNTTGGAFVQKVAFATGVLPNIYAFHRYTRNSTFLSDTLDWQFPSHHGVKPRTFKTD